MKLIKSAIAKVVSMIIGETKTPAEEAMERALVDAILTRNREELTNRVSALSIESGAKLLRFIERLYHEEESELAEEYLARVGKLEQQMAIDRHFAFVNQFANRMLQEENKGL